jgi:hypothetical protein
VSAPPPGTAPERTRLAADRTVLSACALSAVLIKIGVTQSRGLDVVAGCAVGGVAVLAALRRRGIERWRLSSMSALVALGGALLLVQTLA